MNQHVYSDSPLWMKNAIEKAQKQLLNKYGLAQQQRIERGLQQVARFWTSEDGNEQTFISFVIKHFAGTQEELDILFARFERYFEPYFGRMEELTRIFREQIELDYGPIIPIDELFGSFTPNAHFIEDCFKTKIAFVVLLNYPLTTLNERIKYGSSWTRKQWAEVRLTQLFSSRIPAQVHRAVAEAASQADLYISEYNIYMHHILDQNGNRLFPKGLKLLSHWNLRDEIKAQYAYGDEGLQKQRIIQKVMERIIDQTIPAVVINNPAVDWNPYTNTVYPTTSPDENVAIPHSLTPTAEPLTRYEMLLKTFKASRLLDPYSPTAPTHIERKFNEEREIPEQRVRELLTSILTSPLAHSVARIIEHNLQRPLEPFDIWYNGFRTQIAVNEKELDTIVQKKYPTAEHFTADIPRILRTIGFEENESQWIASLIKVESARGAGHATGSAMRGTPARLRTRIDKNGMNYKGYNIALHELGHNVEQTLSLNSIDYYFLNGVPNIAFTEAIAFIFQSKDLELLGLTNTSEHNNAYRTLHEFWSTYEIAGVALVDLELWHWMYNNPYATSAELKEATLSIAKNIWNTYYAPIFQQRDVTLLAIYSHIIDAYLYTPDYPLGHIIAYQLNSFLQQQPNTGKALKEMLTLGRLIPDMWMTKTTSLPVSTQPLLDDTKKALQVLNFMNID